MSLFFSILINETKVQRNKPFLPKKNIAFHLISCIWKASFCSDLVKVKLKLKFLRRL